MNQKKIKKIALAVVIIALIFLIIFMLYLMYLGDGVIKCLKPYAEEYCSEHNYTYTENNIVSFWCETTNDTRIIDNKVYYYFLSEEKKSCGA